MNFENLGARILANVACNQKIWAPEAFRGKIVFLGVSRVIMDFWSDWRVLVQKTGALANFVDF
jgi:hypothetical protein